MWLELGNMFINTDHLVRVEFLQEPKFTATLITVKPGGCDRTFVYDDDARKVKEALDLQVIQVNSKTKKAKV